MCFIAIDNPTGTGIEQLRQKIEDVAKHEESIKQAVPLSYLKCWDEIKQLDVNYLTLREAKDKLVECGLKDEIHDIVFFFLVREVY